MKGVPLLKGTILVAWKRHWFSKDTIFVAPFNVTPKTIQCFAIIHLSFL